MIQYVSSLPESNGDVLCDLEPTDTILQMDTSFLCVSQNPKLVTGKGVHITYLVVTEDFHLDMLLMSISHDYANQDVYVYSKKASSTFERYNYNEIERQYTRNSELIVYKRDRIR